MNHNRTGSIYNTNLNIEYIKFRKFIKWKYELNNHSIELDESIRTKVYTIYTLYR